MGIACTALGRQLSPAMGYVCSETERRRSFTSRLSNIEICIVFQEQFIVYNGSEHSTDLFANRGSFS